MPHFAQAAQASWFRRPVLLATILLSIAGICAAQTDEFTGRAIRSVEYSPAGVIFPADLERIQVLKTGEILRAEDVADAIDRLFATGLFEDIAVEAQPSGDGVAIRFITEPARFISGVTVTGSISTP